MTVSVANTSNTNTFQYWINRTNELATAMSGNAVTVNSTAAVGNAQIIGSMIANSFVSGNSTSNVTISNNFVYLSNSTSNLTLSIPTPSQVSNGNYYLASNGTWTTIPVYTVSQTFSGTNPKQVDTWVMSQHHGAEYYLSVIDNTVNNFQTTKILTIHNFGNAYSTEYGTLVTNTVAGSIGVFSANVDSSNVYLYFTPTSTNTTVSLIRTII